MREVPCVMVPKTRHLNGGARTMFQRMMLIGVLVLLPGCSLAFVDGPPPNLPDTYNPLVSPCTTSKLLPILDLGGTVAYGLAFGSVLGMTEQQARDEYNAGRTSLLVTTGLMGLLFSTSSHGGFGKVKECRNALLTMTPTLTPPRTSLGPSYTATSSWAASGEWLGPLPRVWRLQPTGSALPWRAPSSLDRPLTPPNAR